MKAALVFLLPLLAEAASIQFRQLGGKKAKAVYTYDTKPLKATIRADAQRTLTRVGPIDLVPGVSKHLNRCGDAEANYFTEHRTPWYVARREWRGCLPVDP